MENFQSYSLEAEQSVIGGLILIGNYNSESFQKTLTIVKEKSFYSRSHRIAFDAIKILGKKIGDIDLLTVTDYLERHGQIEECGGFVYFAEMMRNTPSASNIIAYANLVREYAVERFALSKMQDSIALFSDRSNGDIYQRLGLIETTVSEVSNLAIKNESGGLRHITEVIGNMLDEIQERNENGGVDLNKFTTGIESLDDCLGMKCLRRGSLVAVGARPKMGKSAFMAMLANHFALELQEPVALFSLEMPAQEVSERSLTSRANVDPAEFYRRNGMSAEVSGRMESAISEYMKSNFYIDDTPSITIQHIQREARKLRREKGKLGLICVDYLTLMKAGKADRNDLAYGEITKSLKNLAKELNCVVLLLTQLNRGLESRTDKRPVASDSRDTGQIEQDCDVWIGLYRESVYDEEVFFPELTEILVRLNRHGKTGTAFTEMKQGYLLPVSFDDGARAKHEREHKKEEREPKPFKAKGRK